MSILIRLSAQGVQELTRPANCHYNGSATRCPKRHELKKEREEDDVESAVPMEEATPGQDAEDEDWEDREE